MLGDTKKKALKEIYGEDHHKSELKCLCTIYGGSRRGRTEDPPVAYVKLRFAMHRRLLTKADGMQSALKQADCCEIQRNN